MKTTSRARSDRGDARGDRGARRDGRDTVTVATHFARPLGRALAEAGLDPRAVLGPLGLAGPELPPRIPFALAAAAFDGAVLATGYAAIGLRATLALAPGDYGLMEYLARASPTLRAALDRLGRYHRLMNDRTTTELSTHGSLARLRYVVPRELGMPRAYLEFVLATWVRIARETTEIERPVRGVSLPFPAPADPALHHALFGERIAWGSEHAELTVEAAVLDRPSTRADARLVAALDRHATTLLSEARPEPTWAAKVAVVVRAKLSDGPPRLSGIAPALSVSERALRRLLAVEETTFARVVDETRREHAATLLDDASLSLGEIAFLLGFSEPSAFHRAYRRWTGRTPRAHAR